MGGVGVNPAPRQILPRIARIDTNGIVARTPPNEFGV